MQEATNKFLHLLLIMFVWAISVAFGVLSLMLVWRGNNLDAAIAMVFAILFLRSTFSLGKQKI